MRAALISADWEPRPGARLSDAEIEGHCAGDATQVWRHPRWSIAERPTPTIDAADEVLVRSRAVGICGSDLHMYETDADGYMLFPYRIKIPLVPGHEMAGEVVEVGPAVRSVAPGDLVAVEALQYCGHCVACRRGLFSHCSNALDSGFGLDGGMAEYLLTRERNARPLTALRGQHDDQETCEIGALCEPAAVAYLGMFGRAGGFLPGGAAAVFGYGPIGLAAVALARCAGAARIVALDPERARCALALEMGADVALNLTELSAAGATPAEVVMEATGGAGVDLAVEAAGSPAALSEIESILAVGAKVVLLGATGEPVPTRTMAYQVMAAGVHGTIGNVGGFDPVIALQAAGRLDLRPILSARYRLSEALAAMARAAERRDAKVMIVPEGEPTG